MAIPAYAKARIEYLNFRYAVEPKIETRLSYRASSGNRFRIDDSAKAIRLRNEIYCIVDSYNAVPKTPPNVLRRKLKENQKAAFDRAIKQINSLK